MINLFNYTDFVKYLEDYYAWQKSMDPSFTYDDFARKARFNNRGLAYNILHGKRPMSSKNRQRISEALKHTKTEAGYFKNLVAFNQTEGLAGKKRIFEKLCSISAHGKGFTQAQVVTRDQYEFYSTWYHSAVRSLIGMYPFKDDYKWLGKMLVPTVNPGKVKKSVELLERLGMVSRAKNGTLTLTDVSITTGSEIKVVGLGNLHAKYTDLAKSAISTMDRDVRTITGLTLGVSKATYEEISADIAWFEEKIMAKANNDQGADRVYQLNFHLFPLSRTKGKWIRKKS